MIDVDKIDYIVMNYNCPHYFNSFFYDKIVFVTAFLDLKRENWSNFERGTQFYCDSFDKFLNSPTLNKKPENKILIAFIDDTIISKYENYSFGKYQCYLIPINRKWLSENIRSWKTIDLAYNIMMNNDSYKSMVLDRIKNNFPENIYPEYNCINHSKIDFIKFSYDKNLINIKDFVCWVDFGYYFSQLYDNQYYFPVNDFDLSKFNLKKINICMFEKLDSKDTCLDSMNYTLINAPKRFIGSFFAATMYNMCKFYELYHYSLNELYQNNISDDDQHVYLRCFIHNSNLFQLFIGKDLEHPKALKYFQKD